MTHGTCSHNGGTGLVLALALGPLALALTPGPLALALALGPLALALALALTRALGPLALALALGALAVALVGVALGVGIAAGGLVGLAAVALVGVALGVGIVVGVAAFDPSDTRPRPSFRRRPPSQNQFRAGSGAVLRRFASSCVPDCEVTQHTSIEGSLGGLGFHF